MATLKIHMKQFVPVQKSTGQAGYYSGSNPQSLTFVNGILPAARRWQNYGSYIDVTDSIGDPYKLQLTWTLERDSDGATIPNGGISAKKSASGTLTFEQSAFYLLKQWLIDDVSASLNIVQVMIEDVGCGRYTDYQITAKDIIYCENEVCTFNVTLKQLDNPLSCIQRTLISDNWQGWFQPIPSNGKKHPRFSYCNERRPNFLIVIEWFLLSYLGVIAYLFLVVVGVPLIIVMSILLGIATGINVIINFINTLGANINTINTSGLQQAINDIANALAGGLFEAFANFMLEGAGCGREHPAPLIRDYIKNVCDKCGVRVDQNTAPLFFNSQMFLDTNSRGFININNPHYNACYLYTNQKRGLRRFINFNILGNSQPNPNFYMPETRPLLTLDMFLDELKGLYNYEWEITDVNNSGLATPTLFIRRKDYYKYPSATGYVYDFSENGADRNKLIHGICYEWNGKKLPAFIKGLYMDDAADTCGNEAKDYFNDIIETGNIDTNPNYDGELDKTQRFGATRFRLDGVSGDYVYDAMQVVCNLSFLSFFLNNFILASVRDQLLEYADYGLLMKDETCTLPKILLWNGLGFENAKCVRPYFSTSNNGAIPNINVKYNNNGHDWASRHKPETYVMGNSGALAFINNQPYGAYQVKDLLGIITIVRPAMLVNYYMSMAQDFQDSMWDYFHWVDDPKYSIQINQNWNLRIPLCCDDLNRLNVFYNGGAIYLGAKVKLSHPLSPDGKITEITASYDPEQENGQYIELKGTM